MHKLNLDINRSATNCRFLTIQDASIYNSEFPVNNIILEIKPPLKNCYFSTTLLSGWCSKTLDCLFFDLCCEGDCITVLPDGLYEIKYSIEPNIQTMVEFSHFRVCQLWNNYIKALCIYFSKKCDYSKSEKKAKEQELEDIRFLIEASVYEAEDCSNTDMAYILYEEANQKLKNLYDNGCPTC